MEGTKIHFSNYEKPQMSYPAKNTTIVTNKDNNFVHDSKSEAINYGS